MKCCSLPRDQKAISPLQTCPHLLEFPPTPPPAKSGTNPGIKWVDKDTYCLRVLSFWIDENIMYSKISNLLLDHKQFLQPAKCPFYLFYFLFD